MAPTPVLELRKHIDRVQSSIPDPEERIRALQAVRVPMEDLLGMVDTYLNDARLQTQAEGDHAGSQSAGATESAPDTSSDGSSE